MARSSASAEKFRGQVNTWTKATNQRLLAVFRSSAQAVANEVRVDKGHNGNMPVVTGNLRRSLTGSMTEVPRMDPLKGKGKPRKFSDGSAGITTMIAQAKLGETIRLGFQAAYARIQEERNGFVRLTAQRWPKIVAEQARKLQSSVSGRK